MLAHLAAFVALAGVLVAIPGPSVMLIVKSTILRGKRAAMLCAVGVLCGDVVWATAAVAGITALVVASRPAFEAIRLAGAAYLIYLGARLLLRRGVRVDVTAPVVAPLASGPRRAFGEGLLCELSNPKTLIVFTSVIPQFLSHGTGAGVVALYSGLFAVLGFLSLTIYVAVLGATRRAVGRSGRTPDLLLRGSGGLLVAFGVGLIADRG